MYFLKKAGIHFERGHLKGNPLFSEIEKENLNTKGKQLHRERVINNNNFEAPKLIIRLQRVVVFQFRVR